MSQIDVLVLNNISKLKKIFIKTWQENADLFGYINLFVYVQFFKVLFF
jgi:hypothetical protein